MFTDRRRGDVDLRQEVHVDRERSTLLYCIALTEGDSPTALGVLLKKIKARKDYL